MIATSAAPAPGTKADFAVLVQGSDAEALALIRILRTSPDPPAFVDGICRGIADALGKPATALEAAGGKDE